MPSMPRHDLLAAAPPRLFNCELPARYHTDLLHLMVRDARSLYVYWEISDRKKWLAARHLQCDWGDMPKLLRVYDVTSIYFHGSNANAQFDLGVAPDADNWFIGGICPGAAYVVDFGLYTPERQFLPLLRSNAAATPRDTAAGWGASLAAMAVGLPETVNSGVGDVPPRIEPQFFENFDVYCR